MGNEPFSCTGTGLIYEVTAHAGKSRLKISTKDIDYIRRQVRRHMPPFRHEVSQTWYARLDGYLTEALTSGRVEFERYSGTTYIITARVVGN